MIRVRVTETLFNRAHCLLPLLVSKLLFCKVWLRKLGFAFATNFSPTKNSALHNERTQWWVQQAAAAAELVTGSGEHKRREDPVVAGGALQLTLIGGNSDGNR